MAVTFYRYSESIPAGEGEEIGCSVCSNRLGDKTSLRHDSSENRGERVHPHCENCLLEIAQSTNQCSICHRNIQEIRSCSFLIRNQAAKMMACVQRINWTRFSVSLFGGGAAGVFGGIFIAEYTQFTPAYWISPIVGIFCGRMIYDPLVWVSDRIIARCF